MKIDDEVVYTIEITGFTDNLDMNNVSKKLIDLGVRKQKISPVNAEEKVFGSISVPRLFTRWKGPAQEDLFQANVREAVASAQVSINVHPWSHLPGYPRGEIGEVTYEDE